MATKLGSRVSRRASTKAPRIKAAQNATKGTLRRAQRAHEGTGKRAPRAFEHDAERGKVVELTMTLWSVRNAGTKREIQVNAFTPEGAVAIALDKPYRLAKTADKLTAIQVS